MSNMDQSYIIEQIDYDPEDILSDSLQSLYHYEPTTLTTAGAVFVHKQPSGNTITLQTPDTQASNWALHASSIWASSRFLADHIDLLNLQVGESPMRILELGAGAGLPGILIAQRHSSAHVVISDYPDPQLIATLSENVARNNPHGNARAVAYGWGTPIQYSELGGQFDIIIAADTLWNSETHVLLVNTLVATLRRTEQARVHLVAGLHTGRYTLQSFLNVAVGAGLEVEKATEMKLGGDTEREWHVARAEAEDDQERRRWVVWIVLKWK